jgi:hypothetical protein
MPVHVRHPYASYGQFSYVETFHIDLTKLDKFTATEKKGSWQYPQHIGWPIREFPPNFSPLTVIEAVG